MALGRRMLTLTLAMSLGALMFVQLEGSGGGGVGGLFTRVEKPTDASSVRPLVLIDTPILDSAKKATMTKTMQVHEKGLRPKAKATEEDPLLFRHRYQHHDSASNRLLYYQYETKRHPHVVVLDDIGVQSCEAVSSDDQPDTTTITIGVKDQASVVGLTSGAVIVGHELGCVARAPDGTARPWRSTLRERIVGPVPAPLWLADGVSATFVTVPAALNEVYEHGQLEFYHGHPDKLETTRTKRLESLASNGHEDEGARYNFASTESVLADAMPVAGSRRRRLKEPALVKQLAPGARNASKGRRLGHDCRSWNPFDVVQRDFDFYLEKKSIYNCNNEIRDDEQAHLGHREDLKFQWKFGTARGSLADRCYWRTVGEMNALQVGNTYRLMWNTDQPGIPRSANIKIFIA